MTTWDVVGFIGMGLISIITGLVEMNRRRMEKDIEKLEDEIKELREKDEKFVAQISERIHRSEWDRFIEKQDRTVEGIFKMLAEIKDLIHTKQDKAA